MKHPIPALCALATEMANALPDGDAKQYMLQLSAYHNGEAVTPVKPAKMPFYGTAFSNALQAIEMGWSARVAYHSDRIKAAINRGARKYEIDNVLCEVRRVDRPIGLVPQPTDRKRFDSGRMPRTGRE